MPALLPELDMSCQWLTVEQGSDNCPVYLRGGRGWGAPCAAPGKGRAGKELGGSCRAPSGMLGLLGQLWAWAGGPVVGCGAGAVLRVQWRLCPWLTYKLGPWGQRDIPRPRATFLRSQQVRTCYNLCRSSRGQRGHGGGVGAEAPRADGGGAEGQGVGGSRVRAEARASGWWLDVQLCVCPRLRGRRSPAGACGGSRVWGRIDEWVPVCLCIYEPRGAGRGPAAAVGPGWACGTEDWEGWEGWECPFPTAAFQHLHSSSIHRQPTRELGRSPPAPSSWQAQAVGSPWPWAPPPCSLSPPDTGAGGGGGSSESR